MNPFQEEKLCSQCQGNKYYCDDCDSTECGCQAICWPCQGRGSIKIKVSQEELDLLTLKVCEVISNEGFERVNANESHNYIRGLLKDFLTQWFEFDVEKHLDHTVWNDLRKNNGKLAEFGLLRRFAKSLGL